MEGLGNGLTLFESAVNNVLKWNIWLRLSRGRFGGKRLL